MSQIATVQSSSQLGTSLSRLASAPPPRWPLAIISLALVLSVGWSCGVLYLLALMIEWALL